MIYKNNKPAKQQVQSVPSSTLDLSHVEVNQEKAKRSVCIYGTSCNSEKLMKKCKKYGEVKEIVEDRGGLLVVYATSDEASLAVKKLHGENKGADSVPMVACKNFVPPVLATGHNPDIFVVRDLPDEIGIPELWTTLKGDDNHVTHMSILRTSTRHVIICCKKPEGRQALLEISGTRMGNWRVKVELWFEFCFHMTRRNVLLIENLPENSSEVSIKELVEISDGIEYIEIIDELLCALIYCKSKQIVNTITNTKQEKLKISLYQQVAGLRFMAFVDNLHETTKESDIHKLLNKCGIVLKVNVSLDQRTGLKRAVAYFEKEESVENALQLNGSELLGQTISISPSLNKKSSNAVFISNLHRGTQGLHLCLIFQDCGHIESVHIPKQKNIVNGREAGVVVFRDAESIPKALEKNNKCKIRGMRIAVHAEDPYENRGKQKKFRQKSKHSQSGKSGEEKPRKRKKDGFAESPPQKSRKTEKI